MFDYIFVLIYLLNVVDDCFAHVDSAKLTEECKIADICRHDQVPLCGIDSCGEMRTFIDVCDLHEFNCDSRKDNPIKTRFLLSSGTDSSVGELDFVQKPAHECWVTCKRGRSFKKPEFAEGCDKTNMV